MNIRGTFAVVLPAFLAAYLVSFWSVSLAQQELSQESLRTVAATYKAEEWRAGDVRDGFPLETLELEGWQGGQLRSDSGYLRRKFTATGKTENPPSILIEVFVANSAANAHRELLTLLADRQSAAPAPRAQERNLVLGDVGYLGVSGARGNPIEWLAFVAGNISIRVVNTDVRSHPDLDVGAIAKSIDQMTLARRLPVGTMPQLPVIDQLSAEKQVVEAGEVLRLDLKVTDPARGTPHIKWVVGGPGQGYVEANNNNWCLHTTKCGQIRLAVEVTASIGTFASKEIQITVLPTKKR